MMTPGGGDMMTPTAIHELKLKLGGKAMIGLHTNLSDVLALYIISLITALD